MSKSASTPRPKLSSGRNTPSLLALEPRILLDGAMVATAVEHSTDLSADVPDVEAKQQDQPLLETQATEAGSADDQQSPSDSTSELVFVDSALLADQGFSDAVSQLQASRPGMSVISLDRHGVNTISETLADYAVTGVQFDAIHILSHSDAGELGLGSDHITMQSLADGSELAEQIASWGAALTEDGDILLYGCDLAAGIEGCDCLAWRGRVLLAALRFDGGCCCKVLTLVVAAGYHAVTARGGQRILPGAAHDMHLRNYGHLLLSDSVSSGAKKCWADVVKYRTEDRGTQERER